MADDGGNLLNAKVISRHDLTHELSVVQVQPDGGVVPHFEPGQFITLGLTREQTAPLSVASPGPATAQAKAPSPGSRLVRRAYSIASAPRVIDHIELYIVLVEEGKLTPRLWTLHEGDRLWMDRECKGNFTLRDVPDGRDLVMVSTGTGLAPFMSMLRQYRGTGRWRRFVLMHGARCVADLGYRQELEAIGREDPTLVYLPTVTREPADSPWRGQRGRVQAMLEPQMYQSLVGASLDSTQCSVFLCGNPAMIDEMSPKLEARGFVRAAHGQPGNLHYERYW